MSIVPIHNHSHFSSLDGWSTIDEIYRRAQDINANAIGLTDHGLVSGHLQLGQKGRKYGIKPLYGIEAYHGIKTQFKGQERDQAHLVLGALTDEGLRNLWRLTSKAFTNFRFVGRVNWDILKEYSKGLFMTTACIQGLVSQEIKDGRTNSLDKYLDIFRNRLYVEIHTYPTEDQKNINEWLVRIARERGIPLIWASDAHYASPTQYEEHNAYVAMQTGDTINTPIDKRKMWHPPCLYIQSEDEVRDNLSYLPNDVVDECITNSVDLADKCSASLPEIKRHLPVFVPKDVITINNKEFLRNLAFEGLHERYDNPSDEINERLENELDILIEAGLEDYFLWIWDLMQWCKEQKILTGPGRGSAAGSLLVYCLGITEVDPIRYNLYFERFYNAGREKGLPDIDIDFPQSARKKIKDYLAIRLGEKRVCSIGTVMYFKPKAALNRTYKAFGVTEAECLDINRIVSKTPDLEILGPESIGWEDRGEGKVIYVMDHMAEELNNYLAHLSSDRQTIVNRWLDFISNAVGRVQGYGVHASGVVVSDVDLDEELPSFWSASLKTHATQFPMDEVDKRGFLKVDVLGLRNLDTLEKWEELTGREIDWDNLDKEDHPVEMWEMLDKGLTLGIFQIEDSPFAMQLCHKLKPRSVKDLADIGALNRPGPIRSGDTDKYIKRKNGEEDISYDHSFLEDILGDTYGIFLYQEQVINFFSKLGYSLIDADAVRKMLGKKDPEAQARLYHGESEWEGKGYFEVATPILGEEAAQLIAKKLEDFSKYSFNSSHALSYALMGLRTLYPKFVDPRNTIIALIQTNPEEAGLYITEARRMGIEVLPPDITHSDIDIISANGHIYLGFVNIKGISTSSAKYLVELRDKYNIQTAKDLRFILEYENERWEAAKEKNPSIKGWTSPRSRFKSNKIEALENVGAFDLYEPKDISLAEIQAHQKELLGIILTDNSEEIFESNQELVDECDSYEFNGASKVRLPGVVTKIKLTQVRKTGQEMAIVTMEYKQYACTFAVFPEAWRRNRFLFKEQNCVIITLKNSERGASFLEGRLLT